MKAEVYKARLKFLQENGIATADDLTACMQQAENKVTQLAKQRTILNVRKKKRKKLFDALAAEAAFAGFEPRKAEYDTLPTGGRSGTSGKCNLPPGGWIHQNDQPPPRQRDCKGVTL